MTERKRSRNEIISDMLAVIQEKGGKIKPTPLMYKANLSHKQMSLYLQELIQAELVARTFIKDKQTLEITRKGRDFYVKYSQLKEFEKTFGL